MQIATAIKAVIKTAGKVDLSEEIIHSSSQVLEVGDYIALKPTKPTSAPIYGTAQVREKIWYIQSFRYRSVRVS